MRSLRLFVADVVSPVVPVIPIQEPEPSKPEDLWPCDNSTCCAWLPFGLAECPVCGHDQHRLRPAGLPAREHDQRR